MASQEVKTPKDLEPGHHEMAPEAHPPKTTAGMLQLWENKRILGWCKSLPIALKAQPTNHS